MPEHLLFNVENSREQAHLPAQQPPSRQDPRFSAAHAYPRRSRHRCCTPPPWPCSPERVTRRTCGGRRMLPAAARVRGSDDFAAVLKRGDRARRGNVVVHAARRNSDVHGARVGFIVSKAVGPAVTRNLVKRRLRSVAAERLPEWPHDTDIVVRALPSAANATYQRLESDMTGAMATILRRRS